MIVHIYIIIKEAEEYPFFSLQKSVCK